MSERNVITGSSDVWVEGTQKVLLLYGTLYVPVFKKPDLNNFKQIRSQTTSLKYIADNQEELLAAADSMTNPSKPHLWGVIKCDKYGVICVSGDSSDNYKSWELVGDGPTLNVWTDVEEKENQLSEYQQRLAVLDDAMGKDANTYHNKRMSSRQKSPSNIEKAKGGN